MASRIKKLAVLSLTIDLEYAFYNAVGPSGENLSLVNYMGPLVYAAMGEPDSLDFILRILMIL